MRQYDTTSRVEQRALDRCGRALIYPPTEKMGVLEVPDFPSLGRLTALRFLEWLQRNPDGVVALPTGKTPEHFISWALYLLDNWHTPSVQTDLADWGLDPNAKPHMPGVTFVQIDEFYPMNPAHENSFANYIDRFYLKPFGFDRKKALLMDTWHVGAPTGRDLGDVFGHEQIDLSLRYRAPVGQAQHAQYRAITAADQFAMDYEANIRNLGGIGFFLGGIGPDGHIGFNIRGCDHFQPTHVAPINYETAAAAAADLGGIEVARHKVVMTVGLRTITKNPTATAIIIAAGESKAPIVRDAVQTNPSVLHPATALHALPAARFYLTQGAAAMLAQRRRVDLEKRKTITFIQAEQILIDLACRNKKKLTQLKANHLKNDRLGQVLIRKNRRLPDLITNVARNLAQRIDRGLANIDNKTFLHTAPHHDDIMLGYLPYILHLVRTPKNQHVFATLTSGFTAVTNRYTLDQLENLERHLQLGTFEPLIQEGYFAPSRTGGRNRDIYQYLDGVAANSDHMQQEGEARRMLRNLIELIGSDDTIRLKKTIRTFRDYFHRAYPGKKDTPQIQELKGMIREWEEELLWGHLGFNCEHIVHLRLGFYTGDIFTPQPEMKRDVKPVLNLLERTQPDVVTVALDPEASGPDTHYKVLQTIAEALKLYLKKHPHRKITVWGYRNVWYRFHPAEADLFIPVSMNSLAIMKDAFRICFGSQRSASFPSHEYDGPFCDLAQQILVRQFAMIKTCLGRDFFYASPHPRLRATRGLNFLKVMTPTQFFNQAQSLKKQMETTP